MFPFQISISISVLFTLDGFQSIKIIKVRFNSPINLDFKLPLESQKILSMHSPEDKTRLYHYLPYRISIDGTKLNRLALIMNTTCLVNIGF